MVPSILGWSIVRSLHQIPPGKFIHVGLTNDNHPFCFGVSNRCRIKDWLVVVEHFDAAVVKMPSVEILSLTASGIPDRRLSASIPFSSMALACARAASSATVTKALMASSRAFDIVKRRLCQFRCRNFLRDKGGRATLQWFYG